MRNYGRLAERSKAAVLKTVDVQASGGSNPSPSASASGYGSRRSQKGSLAQVPLPILFRTLPRPSFRYNIVHRNGDDSLRSSIPSPRFAGLLTNPSPSASATSSGLKRYKKEHAPACSCFCIAYCLALRFAANSGIEMVTLAQSAYERRSLFRRHASPFAGLLTNPSPSAIRE